MADTLRESLKLQWAETDGPRKEEASVDDLHASVTRDNYGKAHVFGALVYAGRRLIFRSLDYTPNVGSLDRAKALCELAIGAECWRRATS